MAENRIVSAKTADDADASPTNDRRPNGKYVAISSGPSGKRRREEDGPGDWNGDGGGARTARRSTGAGKRARDIRNVRSAPSRLSLRRAPHSFFDA